MAKPDLLNFNGKKYKVKGDHVIYDPITLSSSNCFHFIIRNKLLRKVEMDCARGPFQFSSNLCRTHSR